MLEQLYAILPYVGGFGLFLLPLFLMRGALRRDGAVDWIELKRLSDTGVNLEAPRKTEFIILVQTEPSAQYVSQTLEADGFSTRYEQGGYSVKTRGVVSDQDSGYLVWATKVVVLHGDTTKFMRQELSAIASKENGKYLGWRAVDVSPMGGRAEA